MQIGVMVADLSASQLSYVIIKNMNNASKLGVEDDYVVFYENITPCVLPPLFGILNSTEIPSFNGELISTNISTTLTMLNSVSPSNKYFYVWDLEWLRPTGRNFKHNIEAFCNPSIKLIARSDSHALAIYNYCNRKVVGIVEDFNLTQLKEILSHGLCKTTQNIPD